MKKLPIFATALLMGALFVTACSDNDVEKKTSAHLNARAHSIIINNDNAVIGHATYTQGPEGVLMRVQVAGLPSGPRGMHFHEVGTCDDHEAFHGAGAHIMPSKRPHGYLHPEGPHEGNLPNLMVHEDGTVVVELYTDLVSLYGDNGRPALLDKDGSTLIIHASEDDHVSQPIGNAGARIACGIVVEGDKPEHDF